MKKNYWLNRISQIAKVLFLGCFLFVFGFRCNSTVTPANSDAPALIDVEEADFPSKLKTGVFYVGKADGKEYAVKFNIVQTKTLHGTFYDVTTASVAEPVKFTAQVKGKKIVLTLNKTTSHTWKNVVVRFSENQFSGKYAVGNRSAVFFFHLYSTPDFEEYKNRYKEECFEYEVVKDVKYGSAIGFWTSNVNVTEDYWQILSEGIAATFSPKELDLKMDLYLPKNDSLRARPLLMFIHGGAFYIGSKEDNPIVKWCKHYAAMGYVVASIDYRMGFHATKTSIERCGFKAVQDAHAAMRFLVHNKDKYNIDPDYLFVAGTSAGGITSLNLAFMRNENRPESVTQNRKKRPALGNIESSGNKLTETFHIRAVANMWGAVQDISILQNSKTSIISFHGNADNIVPYDYDMPFQDLKLGVNKLFFDKMYGSAPIHRKAKELGYREELHTLENCCHAPHVDAGNQVNEKFWFIQEKTTDFFFKEFLPEEVEIQSVGSQWYEVNVPEIVPLTWAVDGGIILEQKGNKVRVAWLRYSSAYVLKCSGKLSNGARIFAEKAIQF